MKKVATPQQQLATPTSRPVKRDLTPELDAAAAGGDGWGGGVSSCPHSFNVVCV